MMREWPIIFTGVSIPMVMDGTKTQTRRIADLDRLRVDVPRSVMSDLPDLMPLRELKRGRYRVRIGQAGAVIATPDEFGLKPGEFHFRCPLMDGVTYLADFGDRKCWMVTPEGDQRWWVKETWGRCDRGKIIYRADDVEALAKERQWVSWPTWRSPYHMCRGASRTNLVVITARLQHLQDITDEDAIAEGVMFRDYGTSSQSAVFAGRQLPGWSYGPSTLFTECSYSPRQAYMSAWNQIHAGPRWVLRPGPSPWDLNPWVWAYTFRREVSP
jgi:hypothetical protein